MGKRSKARSQNRPGRRCNQFCDSLSEGASLFYVAHQAVSVISKTRLVGSAPVSLISRSMNVDRSWSPLDSPKRFMPTWRPCAAIWIPRLDHPSSSSAIKPYFSPTPKKLTGS